MLKYFTFVFIISLLHTATSIAQQNSGQRVSVTISAEIISTIDLITVRPIDFSNTGRNDGQITINPVSSGRAGKMIAQGTPGASFRITFLRQRDLVNIDGENVLFFSYMVSGNVEDDQSTSELLEDDNRALQFNESGQFFIWVGGDVNLQSAPPGNYEGEFTLEIEYN